MNAFTVGLFSLLADIFGDRYFFLIAKVRKLFSNCQTFFYIIAFAFCQENCLPPAQPKRLWPATTARCEADKGKHGKTMKKAAVTIGYPRVARNNQQQMILKKKTKPLSNPAKKSGIF